MKRTYIKKIGIILFEECQYLIDEINVFFVSKIQLFKNFASLILQHLLKLKNNTIALLKILSTYKNKN